MTAITGGAVSNTSMIRVRGFSTVLGVAASDNCAADDSGGEIYCWGDGYPISKNRPDLGTRIEYGNPIRLNRGQIPLDARIVQLAPGFRSSCAGTDFGEAYCWAGSFEDAAVGKLGTGGVLPMGAPALVVQGERPAAATFLKIAQNNGSQCGLVSDGWVYCWGDRQGFTYASAPSSSVMMSPAAVARGSFPVGDTVIDMAMGQNNSCLLSSSGRIYCNYLGAGFTVLPQGEIPSNVKIVKISGEGGLTVNFWSGLGDDGWVYSWGSGFGKRFGTGSSEFVSDQRVVRDWLAVRSLQMFLSPMFRLARQRHHRAHWAPMGVLTVGVLDIKARSVTAIRNRTMHLCPCRCCKARCPMVFD